MKTGFQSSPTYVAGCRMPSANTIELADVERVKAARTGSEALKEALHRYFLNGGRG